jgi:C-terminal processing protease CtpA/Prc
MDAAEQRAVIEAFAKEVEDLYVFPDVAARYARAIRANQAAGAYARLTDPAAFGERVTADLQAISPDRHLRLAPEAAFRATMRAMGSGAAGGGKGQAPDTLEEAKMIGEVAYLRFNLFANDETVAARARAFLVAHADAKAVILDCRPNRGGSMMVMDAILPLLFAQTTTLVRLDTRAASAEPEDREGSATLAPQPAPPSLARVDHVVTPDTVERRLQHVPVYYLTSKRTGSAAEHLALAFKHTRRATVIGETTAGAGHFGGLSPIAERFAAFIPTGRTYDPDTGEDWEAKGVAPDVAVPADQALDEALRRAAAAGVRV